MVKKMEKMKKIDRSEKYREVYSLTFAPIWGTCAHLGAHCECS
jgi:hypothetical protein